MSEREGLQDDSETCYGVWFGDGGTDNKRQEVELEVAELKMLFSLGVTRMDSIRNEYMRETVQVERQKLERLG